MDGKYPRITVIGTDIPAITVERETEKIYCYCCDDEYAEVKLNIPDKMCLCKECMYDLYDQLKEFINKEE